MLQAPVDVLTGRVTGSAAVAVVVTQVLWLAATVLAGRVVYALGVRALVVQGG
jgi:ABC-2 type transport system permease protein